MKTNAARILDGLRIAYELRDYAVDEDDLSAVTVARKVGLPPEQVFKTLLCRGDRSGVFFAVIPAAIAGEEGAVAELDLKALARLSQDRSVALVALREVQPLTGYVRGGVTVLGAKKELPVYVDESVELFDLICVSAGVRGTQLVLAPGDYLRAARAKTGPIARAG